MNIRVNRVYSVTEEICLYKHIHTQNQTRKFEEKNPVTDFLLW